jgi:SAM-dependent methyltransferase
MATSLPHMNNPVGYVRSNAGVYVKPGYPGLRYSDGDEIEERLLRHLSSIKDISDGSIELRAAITDWPSEYHFSPLRANLLRPFSFSGKRILELGCGCGAITRFLGESGAEVIAVEGSARRAAIAAARCRDLPNVRIYCDNIADFPVNGEFDVVTLIGVLEYSRLFLTGDDPVQRCLELAGNHLCTDGELYVAIENQLGLKYFNGCSEDHLGIPFFGIMDCYGESTPVTFGRKELDQRMEKAGLEQRDFFLPFPDYKLPTVILSESALAHPSLRIADLLCRINSRDYGRVSAVSFNESLAWRALTRNGLVSELANSFLVRACKRPFDNRTAWCARTYSAGRLPAFSTENVVSDKAGKLSVVKRRLFNNSVLPADSRFEHRTGIQQYVEGDLYVVNLQHAIATGAGFDDIVAWVRPWLAFLNESAYAGATLPGQYLDCIPINLVRDGDEMFHYIDAEWCAKSDIPLCWVAVRGLIISISACPSLKMAEEMSYRSFATKILTAAGLDISDADWSCLCDWEDALMTYCFGTTRDSMPFADMVSRKVLPWTTAPTCREMLSLSQEEIKRLKSTVSWRLTKPLRGFYNGVRRLFFT